jgi:hypothetical protein
MKSFFSEKQIDDFKKLLTANGVDQELELEGLQPYPHVLKNLEKHKLYTK